MSQGFSAALADSKCRHCLGEGYVLNTGSVETGPETCDCVYRAVFNACYSKWVAIASKDDRLTTRRAEYAADFVLVCTRHLSDLDLQIFKFRYLYRAAGKLVERRLHLNRDQYQSRKKRMKVHLGKVLCTLQPYPLYPIGEYFTTVRQEVRASVS